MRIFLAVLVFSLSCRAQTQVDYPSQIKRGPLYVVPTIGGLPTVCSANTPLYVVGNALYQNTATPPACNWQQTGTISPGTLNYLLKYTGTNQAGPSGVQDNGATVSTVEKVDFSSSPQTLPVTVVPALINLPSTGCKPGQLAIVLAASASGQIYENSGTGTCAWVQQGGGGGGTIGVTSNVLQGDGVGNAISSGIPPSTVVVTTGSYSNPGWLAALAEVKITFTDNITGNVSAAAHGFTPKLPNSGTVYLNGLGAWTTPPGTGGGTIPTTTNLLKGDGAGNASDSLIPPANVIVSTGSYANPTWLTSLADLKIAFTNITTGNATSSQHGYLPKLSGVSTQFLNGIGTFTTPAGGGGGWTVNTVTFSSTPVFDFSLGNLQVITLTGNVSASSVSNVVIGPVLWQVCQDSSGNHTFVWPPVVHGAITIGLLANKCSEQWFASTDGTNFYATSTGAINQ